MSLGTPSPVEQRRGGVLLWAAAGLVWVAISAQAIVRWMLSSDQFTPAPIVGPDTYPVWREVSLRVLEVLSMAVLLSFVWFCVIRPLRRDPCVSR